MASLDPVRLAGVDAFTATPMAGNGAVVALLPCPASDRWMQALAAELQQSETAFLWHDRSADRWALRWFTPSCEVPLCGHATLAATLALSHWGLLVPGDGLALHTRSGPLAVGLDGDGGGAAWLDLPTTDLIPRSPDPWMSALPGGAPRRVWTSSLGYGVLLLEPGSDLALLDPRADAWAAGPEPAWVVMRAGADAADPGADYGLRFFAPGLGLAEDPVTGSAHALVAPWWCRQLERSRVRGWQPSHRPGGVTLEPLRSGMIRLFGSGVLLWDGQMSRPPEPSSAASWAGVVGWSAAGGDA
jgi:predicted PhzF superfamily epimerase YddE/YHI9